MADYGNYFTSNSGNYNYNTRGHSYDDSDWVIVGLANSGNVSQPIPHPNGAEFTGNNTTCYFYTTNHMSKPNREVKTGNDYVAYFNWATANKNTIGSVDGDFNFYPFGSKTDSRFVEPTELDDTKHGVSPYSNSNNNVISRTNLTVKGTTFTAGYRRHKIQYEPSIRYDLDSYNYGTNDNYKSDGSIKATGGRVVTQRYDAFQTFYNIEDPYSVLNISIANHDDAKSSSPTFCTLTNNKSEYRISHSYTYNPYTNSATWNNTNYLSFTYNTLPTYPKELVFTYASNYKSISYDGDTITVEAKARYNGTYDRFTTSTANDDGFSSYKRYVDVTYSLSTFNSSTTPTGSNTYTFRIWQPGSKLGISYTWSIDSNPSWVHLSTTSGNTTKVTFDDQGDDKPSVGGTLSLSLNDTTISNGGSTTGSVSGVSWTAPTNKSARSCVLRQNMTVTNYCAQNITPKTSSGQPYQSLTLTQNGMTWNNPSFDMKWKVTQKSKTTTTYNDIYGHGWPTINIGGISTSDGTEKTTGWYYNTSLKSVSVLMPTISKPWVNTYSGGKVTITKGSNTAISYKGGSVTINLDPNITFRQGFTSGVSERTWTISNTANNATNQEYWSLNKFNDVVIKLPAIAAANHAFGNATLSWRDTGTQDLTFSKSSRTWNNSNSDDSFTTTLASNLPYIGSWTASASGGSITFKSTTKNSSSTSGTISFYGSTYQDGVLTPSPSTITISQNGTSISGTIYIKAEGTGIKSCDGSSVYPIDGNTRTASYSLKPKEYIHVTKVENLAATITSPTNRNVIWQGETIYFGKKSGTVTTETTSSKTYPYKITVSSNIVSTYPSNATNGVILSNSVTPYEANYVIEYSVDSGSWTTSTTATIGQRPAVWSSSPSLVVRSSGWTNVNEGIYKYTRGWYASQGSTTHTVAIRVRDRNNSDKVFSGTSASITQDGQGGYSTDTKYTFTTGGTNCTTSTPSATGSSAGNYGSFSVSPWSPISDPSGNQGSENDISNYIYNYSNKLSEGYWDSSTVTAEFIGESKTFGYGESISMKFGVRSSSPDTKVWIYTGKKTWNYKYEFWIKASNESNYHYSTLTGTGSTGPRSNITYYRKISFDGGSWSRLDTNGEKTITLTSTGEHTVKVGWWSGNDGPYHTQSKTITLGQITVIYHKITFFLYLLTPNTVGSNVFNKMKYTINGTDKTVDLDINSKFEISVNDGDEIIFHSDNYTSFNNIIDITRSDNYYVDPYGLSGDHPAQLLYYNDSNDVKNDMFTLYHKLNDVIYADGYYHHDITINNVTEDSIAYMYVVPKYIYVHPWHAGYSQENASDSTDNVWNDTENSENDNYTQYKMSCSGRKSNTGGDYDRGPWGAPAGDGGNRTDFSAVYNPVGVVRHSDNNRAKEKWYNYHLGVKLTTSLYEYEPSSIYTVYRNTYTNRANSIYFSYNDVCDNFLRTLNNSPKPTSSYWGDEKIINRYIEPYNSYIPDNDARRGNYETVTYAKQFPQNNTYIALDRTDPDNSAREAATTMPPQFWMAPKINAWGKFVKAPQDNFGLTYLSPAMILQGLICGGSGGDRNQQALGLFSAISLKGKNKNNNKLMFFAEAYNTYFDPNIPQSTIGTINQPYNSYIITGRIKNGGRSASELPIWQKFRFNVWGNIYKWIEEYG